MQTNAIRSTQRAPRSCSFCTRRKIKCDKHLPCRTCRRRGRADDCQIETVVVKGRVVQHGVNPTQPSYSELARENEALKAQVAEAMRSRSTSVPAEWTGDTVDEHEQQLYRAIKIYCHESVVSSSSEVLFPSAVCCERLLDYGSEWMWIHFAVDQKRFEEEVTCFVTKCKLMTPVLAAEPVWLSLLFAYMASTLVLLTDEECVQAHLPYDNRDTVLQNWYNSSLFFLNRANFLRVLDIRSVQSIAILCQCLCANFADFNVFNNLLACGFRIAGAIGLNRADSEAGDFAEAQFKRRLWWSMIQCDWMCFQLGPTCVKQQDFSVPMPENSRASDETRSSTRIASSVDWFILVIRVCCALNHFQSSLAALSSKPNALAEAVASADNDLANIIGDLSAHLQIEGEETESNVHYDMVGSWVPWQRSSITIILFYYRMVVNRVSFRYEDDASPSNKRAIAVCLDSAHGIISTLLAFKGTRQRPRIWFLLLPLYSATAMLIIKPQFCRCESTESHNAEIWKAITFFESIAQTCTYASFAATTLKELLETNSQLII